MDIIERLENPEMYVDAIDDAINEIKFLRNRVSKNEDLEGMIWAIAMKLGGKLEVPYQLLGEAKSKGNSITTWNNSIEMKFIIEASRPTQRAADGLPRAAKSNDPEK